MGRPAQPALKERNKDIKRLYITGLTLKEVGSKYSLSRQRIKQILEVQGISGTDGGKLLITEKKRQQKEIDFEQKKGCTRELWNYLRSFHPNYRKTPIGRFIVQRKNAKRREIPWELTLEQWWSIWLDSKKWFKRGRTDGEYVMGRYGDSGAYRMGNIYITTCNQNAKSFYSKEYM